MGLKNKKKNIGFEPLPLTDGEVQRIFKRCVADKTTADDNCDKSILFSKFTGFKPEDEEIVLFDKKKANENRKNILYLYGQLKNVHFNEGALNINEAFFSYLDEKWTTRKGVLLEFLYLGAMGEYPLLSPFYAKNNTSYLSKDIIKPTLSPRDPNFPAWWEEHKSEWEDPKKEGPEPADD